MRKHNWHPKLIETYLEKYYKNIDTRDTARVYLKHFFTTMNEDPNKFLKKTKKDITSMLWDYTQKIEGRAPKTQNSMLSFIRKFLVRNKKNIDDVEWEEMRNRNNLKRAAPITKKKTPTLQDLKKLLSYTTSIKAKSLFVFCASTGLRIDEALSLTFDDLDMEKRQVELIDETAKLDITRYTFFTPESKELLELWIPEREKMLQTRYKKSKYLREKLEKQGYEVVKNFRVKSKLGGKEYKFYHWDIKKDGRILTKDEIIALDRRIWPFEYINAQRMWATLLEKAGHPYNEINKNPKLKFKKYLYNEHCLRRFWFTQLIADRVNDKYINFIGGHISELDSSYTLFESEVMQRKLKEEYDQHMGCLSIFETVPDLSGVHEQLKEVTQDNKELRQQLNNLRMELLEFKFKQVQEIQRKNKT